MATPITPAPAGAQALSPSSESEKHDVVHLEAAQTQGVVDVDPKLPVDDTYGLVKSRFDEMSIPRTLWVFRRVVLVSLAVYTGYVCEGFEVSEGIDGNDEVRSSIRSTDATTAWVPWWTVLLHVVLRARGQLG
jgi:hypothetical protein